MRFVIAAAATLAVIALAAFDAPRANGAYTTTNAADAIACARLCTSDTLCMAWVYTENACALRATVPTNLPANVASGVSTRAPQSLRPQPIALTPPAAPIATPAPEIAAAPPPRAPEPVETAMLLGGPEDEPTSLRPAFGGSR